MKPEQIIELSAWLNTQANLPLKIQAMADELKESILSATVPVEAPVDTEASKPK